MTPYALLLIVFLLIAACGTEEPLQDSDIGQDVSSNDEEPDDVTLDGDWVLTGATIDGTPLTLLDDWRVTMSIAGSEITGRAACNGYSGAVDTSDGAFVVGQVGQTEMACEPQVMEIESAFTGALTRAAAASRSGDVLTVTGDGVDMLFATVPPVPTADLVDTTWVLDTLIEGEAASSTFADAQQATLHLADDGTFIGGTGCRSVAGDYVVTGDTVQFTNWGADGDCPQSLTTQDSRVITVLEGPFTVNIDGNRLTIMSPGGEGLGYLAQP